MTASEIDVEIPCRCGRVFTNLNFGDALFHYCPRICSRCKGRVGKWDLPEPHVCDFVPEEPK